MRTAAKRDANEREIIATLERLGCYVESVSGPGLADTLVHRNGRLWRAEVKGARKGLTARQVIQFGAAHRAGVPTFILRTEADALDLLTDRFKPWHPSDGACAPEVKQRKHRLGFSRARTFDEMCRHDNCGVSRLLGRHFCAAHVVERR